MNQSTTLSQIGLLLGPAIVITMAYGYIPTELSLLRSVLAVMQLGCMLGIVAVALRALLRDF